MSSLHQDLKALHRTGIADHPRGEVTAFIVARIAAFQLAIDSFAFPGNPSGWA